MRTRSTVRAHAASAGARRSSPRSGPASWDAGVARAADRRRRRCLPPQLLPRRTRPPRARRSRRSAPPPSGSAARSRSSATCRGRSCGSASCATTSPSWRPGMHVTLTPREVEGDGETIPVSWPGVTSLHEDELVYLADGSIRLRVRRPRGRRGRLRGRGRRHALLAQGDEHPRRRPTAGGDRRRPRLGRVRGRARASTCSPSPSSPPPPTSSRSASGCARSAPTSR